MYSVLVYRLHVCVYTAVLLYWFVLRRETNQTSAVEQRAPLERLTGTKRRGDADWWLLLGNALLGTTCDGDTELASFSVSATAMPGCFYNIRAILSQGREKKQHFLLFII